MTTFDIVRIRLNNQQLHIPKYKTPGEVVAWMGAMQAQDFMGAKWAIGMRLLQSSEEAIYQAIREKTIVRTWPMRGTLHFVSPADIRWMLALMAPRAVRGMASRFRQLELDDETLTQGANILIKILTGGRSATRDQIYSEFEKFGIRSKNQRGLHIIGKCAHDGLVCFGAPIGKQQTFVLLDEWVPKAKKLSHEESLAILTTRYFTSHGPATLQDFVWWTGLSVSEAREGISLSNNALTEDSIGGIKYWMGKNIIPETDTADEVRLLPPFDEYLVGYRDRRATLENMENEKSLSAIQYLLSPTILINGKVVGLWRREIKKEKIYIKYDFFRDLTVAEKNLLHAEATRYASFFNKELICK